ncbi:hypothetical protein L1987_85242 [Smallanthus sonchifolius]|uniref:Uncharacterized protein n=1 Tax=Smallanthus sonchifolius TaxID=185202 RepID=A0ACB8Y065_9ASTR|nr:hypothetical protein L1987_85242 [Smallanthus sonchifolius]
MKCNLLILRGPGLLPLGLSFPPSQQGIAYSLHKSSSPLNIHSHFFTSSSLISSRSKVFCHICLAVISDSFRSCADFLYDMGDSQYSFSLTTFSPSGKLVQIEHALTAVGSGQTSLGIKASNGVVIATEKKLPSILVDETSVQKIQILTPNIGVVYSGMGPDSRVLVRKSRKQAEQYQLLYKEPIPVTQLVRETAAVMQEFTQSGGVRPFGVSLLVVGYDDKGPQLYQVDPSGSYFSWKASAMGKNVSNAKTFLEKRYTDDMELEDAIHTAILTLKEGFEGQISGKNIEIGVIEADRTFRVLTAAQIEDYLQEVE